MQQKPQPVRIEQEYNEMIKAMMVDRLWSYNKAINFIVRSYFLESEKAAPKREVVTKKPRVPTKRFIKPTWEEVAKYFYEQGSQTCQDDATRFIDYYEANGWKVGKNAMKDWQATVRTWIKRKEDDKQSGSKAISSNSKGAGYDRDSTDW